MTKKIWMYWHQGFDQANTLVQYCVTSWQYHNPEWEVILLDAENVHDYISPIDIPKEKLKRLKVQHLSDLIRTKILITHGGVWADPTCFCIRPLSEWITPQVEAGFFFFHKPGRDRILGNWFIAVSAPNDYFLTRIYERLCNYWTKYDFRNHFREYPKTFKFLVKFLNRTPMAAHLWLSPLFTRVFKLYPYMIYHYIAYELVRTEARCKAMWEVMPKISALGPPRLQRIGLLNPITEEAKRLIDEKCHPLFKLKWRIEAESIRSGTVLHYLFQTIS